MFPLLPFIRAWVFHLYHALLPAERLPAAWYCSVIASRERAAGREAPVIFFVQSLALYSRVTPHVCICTDLANLFCLAADARQERKLMILWSNKSLQATGDG